MISTPEAIHVPSDEQYEQPEQLDGTKTFSSLGFLDLLDNSYDYQAYDGGKNIESVKSVLIMFFLRDNL